MGALPVPTPPRLAWHLESTLNQRTGRGPLGVRKKRTGGGFGLQNCSDSPYFKSRSACMICFSHGFQGKTSKKACKRATRPWRKASSTASGACPMLRSHLRTNTSYTDSQYIITRHMTYRHAHIYDYMLYIFIRTVFTSLACGLYIDYTIFSSVDLA